MKKFILSLLFIVSLITANAETKHQVYVFRINDEINSRAWIYTQSALKEAAEKGSELVILHLNTYGGEVSFADSIRTAILNDHTPIVAFVDNNAASAGALIAIACDHIYMRSGASIGAATVVNGVDGQAMPDKYQSYMRATMRATAEAHGKDSLGRWYRDPLIAEAMVDDRISIEGVIDSSKTLTFTTSEAIAHHYCEGQADDIYQVLEYEGYTAEECIISEYTPSPMDSTKGWLTGSALRGILIMIIIGGIYFELQSPGIGFPTVAAIVAALLYFAPLYLDGLAAYWEILLFVAGLILIILEIFVIPGFGIAGITGILAVFAGLVFAMLDNDFLDFSTVVFPDVTHALFSLLIGLILGFIFILWLSNKIGSKGVFSRLALNTAQNTDQGYIGVAVENKTGSIGVATVDMHPSGKILIDGSYYDAATMYGSFIAKGTTVRVIKQENGRMYVVAAAE